MANDVKTNVDLNSMDSDLSISLKNEILYDPKNSEASPDQIDIKYTNPDGTHSSSSSTYANCDENDSLTEEKPEEINGDTEKNGSIEIVSKKGQETCEKNNTSELFTDKTETNSENCLTYEDVNNGDNQQNDFVEVVQEELNENDRDDQIKNEKPYSNDSIHNVDETNEIKSGLYNNEQYLDDENYESEERRKSFEKTDPENEECSDFDSTEQDNDRENGDGQEGQEEDVSAAQKKLDDDEDRHNPQYIPKKGFFYEHDDRTADASLEEETGDKDKESEPKEPEGKGRGRRAIPDGKWQHDLYRDDEQKPKSSQELIDIYGYDIRNEESAPKARRRRKYGRGPNKYTRKWDDENAYDKQVLNTRVRAPRQKLPHRRDEYEAEFPVIKDTKSRRSVPSQDGKNPIPKREQSHSASRSDTEVKLKDEYQNHTKKNLPCSERSRSFTKRLTVSNDRPVPNPKTVVSHELKQIQKPSRTPMPGNFHTARSRGRGIGHGKNSRYDNSYESERSLQPSRMQFTSANRGRAKRLVRPNEQYFPGKSANEIEIQELSNQMSSVDLRSVKRTVLNKNQFGVNSDSAKLNEQPQSQVSTAYANSTVRSKRYSHQRQRLLPDSSGQNPLTNINIMPTQNIQSLSRDVLNIQSENDLCHSEVQKHPSLSYMAPTQLASSTQNSESSLSANASSIQSSSLAVSASLIPLSAPPLTASAAPLPGTAPPLPIVGFFQHPQDPVIGFTNQGTPAQLYAREQTVLSGPSNQPVQLVAFLPASPMLSNTNHSQSNPPPPPPPPPPSFPTAVMSYQQASQTQQTTPSFNSESYSIPPVTLAPMPQAPEMYQSRGGVTYYNTRSQFNPRSPPPPRVKLAIPIVPPPSSETMK